MASSIVLVCRKRDKNAEAISRRDFQRELKDHLRDALEEMIGGVEGVSPVAPVDLAQAVIGPGMAVFSKYSSVLEADGSPMTVHTALTLINKMLTDGADDFDSDTHFCLAWFDEEGWADGDFGQADVLARAKGTSVQAVAAAGVVRSGGGNVRLFKPAEYPADWRPENDNNTPVWEAHLCASTRPAVKLTFATVTALGEGYMDIPCNRCVTRFWDFEGIRVNVRR
ncbi:hypothetical protein [Burkholderia thailandensis]|uniref:hypothetical protein n=1 Tax=Burkholderia thailandensis TaxID=57975 RepID=UPI001F179FBC|nr:hypothetical protein [Burkholderia thailandensis]